MVRKSDAGTILPSILAFVKAQTGNQCKEIICDNAPEFIGKNCPFRKHFEELGGKILPSTPHIPSENGIAELGNRRRREISDALLIQSRLGKTFWAETNRMAHILIGKQLKTINGTTKTIDEWFCGQKPLLSDIHAFGCLAYAWIPKPIRKKFQDRYGTSISLRAREDKVWSSKREK